MKGEIQDCFCENGSLFAERSLGQRVWSEQEGTGLKASVITGYCISTEEMGRMRSKWIAVKEAKGMKRFREDEEGEFSQRWWPIRNGAWMRRTEPRVNLQASDLSAGETQWRFILMHCEWPQLHLSLLLCLIVCHFPSWLCVFITPDICTLCLLSQPWVSLLPAVCLVKYSTFKLNSLVHLKNLPWVLPPGCSHSL